MNRIGSELKAELKSVFKRPSPRKDTEEENIRIRRENAALRAQFPSRKHIYSSRKRHKTKRMNWKDLDPNNLPRGPQGTEDPTESQSNLANYPSSRAQSDGETQEQGQASWFSDKEGLIDVDNPMPDGSPVSSANAGRRNTISFNSNSQNAVSVSANRSQSRQLGEAGFSAVSGGTEWTLNPGPVSAEKPKSGGAKLSKGGDEANEAKARDRIYKQFRKLEKEYPSINFQEKLSKSPSLVQMDAALEIVIGAFVSTSRTASDMKNNHNTQLRIWTDKLEKAAQENARKIGQVEGEARERERRLSKDLEKQQSEKQSLVKNYSAQIQKLESEVTSLNAKLIRDSLNLKQQYEQQLGGLRTQLSKALAKNDEDNARWKTYSDGLEARLRNEFNEKKRLIENDYQSKKKAQDEAVLRARQDLDQVISTRDRDIENVKTAWKAEVTALRADWKTEVMDLKAAHEADKAEVIKGKEETIEELKTALVKRDHFKAMSDREVANNFREINTYVDDFARAAYPWDESKMVSWPFQAHQLQNLGNDRRTKQNIIHNTLWVILFDMIFCTPFRMFGKEGRSLENDWVKQYGNELKFCGVPCPRPSKESEISRYETMKVCFEAISRTSGQNGDFYYRTKQGYELTLKEASDEMFQELEKVTSLGNTDMQRLDELVKKAAKMWLEVGQQRCRMFLFMSETGQEKPMRSGPAALNQNRSMNLVITPELRRYGNSQGEKLEKHELVMDCKGKFSVFQSS